MDIEYKKPRYRSENTLVDSIVPWLVSNLASDGIESQVRKTQLLLALIGEQWLIENKDRLDDVVNAIGCEGYNHKLVDSN